MINYNVRSVKNHSEKKVKFFYFECVITNENFLFLIIILFDLTTFFANVGQDLTKHLQGFKKSDKFVRVQ